MSHKIERAVIMAAGKGTRMRPLTDTVPKPLIKVNGRRMIDTVINALHKQGISEIYVVVGYLKEQFYQLETEYENLTVIENPYYDECNNISSLYVAREHIENAIILDGDLIIYNDNILNSQFDNSGYFAIWTDYQTDEWVLSVDDNKKVLSCKRDGDDRGWQLISISRWTREDGIKLRNYLEYEFDKMKNRNIYWDDVPVFLHFNEFELEMTPVTEEDVIEIDSYEELLEIDDSYRS